MNCVGCTAADPPYREAAHGVARVSATFGVVVCPIAVLTSRDPAGGACWKAAQVSRPPTIMSTAWRAPPRRRAWLTPRAPLSHVRALLRRRVRSSTHPTPWGIESRKARVPGVTPDVTWRPGLYVLATAGDDIMTSSHPLSGAAS